MEKPEIHLQSYFHSPAHYAIATGDHLRLSKLISSLPRLADPSMVHSESDSLAQEQIADKISSILDRRDTPNRETALHLAVRLNDLHAAKALVSSGADVSLQNAAGWNSLQEAICSRKTEIAVVLLRHHHAAAWAKWRRRLPRLIAALRRMPDFYMEMSFHFESSLFPFARRLAPSDTYKIWKRGASLRADTSLAGFDGLKIQRANQSFLFLGDGHQEHGVDSGSLLVLNRSEKKIVDAFQSAGAPLSPSDEIGFAAQTNVYRPGVDITKAELVGRTNWRRQERTETVGEWKAKVYELQNVVFTFKSKKAVSRYLNSRSVKTMQLVFNDDEEDDFLVAENPNFITFEQPKRRYSSFEKEDVMKQNRDWISIERRSVDLPSAPQLQAKAARMGKTVRRKAEEVTSKESEYVKSLRPSVWLTEQFPLKTEELLPLLDILANKVKAVRRLRELLATKFPPGTFPVKISIPVVPTVRVVVTFTKFVNLDAEEQFYTPLSSPCQFSDEQFFHSERWNCTKDLPKEDDDPFAIPKDYSWAVFDCTVPCLRPSKSSRKKH